MSKAEIQRQFDYAVRQIVKQGCPAYWPNKGCAYRMEKGDTSLKCVVGWLIPDAYFKKRPEHVFDHIVKELSPSVYSYPRMKPFARNRNILESLQQAHDDAAERVGSGSAFVASFLLDARDVAQTHGLKWNFEWPTGLKLS
jgi:hypothetical protein